MEEYKSRTIKYNTSLLYIHMFHSLFVRCTGKQTKILRDKQLQQSGVLSSVELCCKYVIYRH